MATLLEPLLRDVALLEGRRQEAQLDRLRAQRSIDHVLWTIDERAREDARRAVAARTEAVRAAEKAEADRLRGLEVDGIAQQLLPGLKALLPSASHFAQAVGMRVVEIIDTPELAWHLPDAVEPGR